MSCGESDPEKSHLEVESDSEIKEKVSDKKNLGKIFRSNAPQIAITPKKIRAPSSDRTIISVIESKNGTKYFCGKKEIKISEINNEVNKSPEQDVLLQLHPNVTNNTLQGVIRCIPKTYTIKTLPPNWLNNQIEKQTIQRTIASLKKSTETYDLSNLAKKLGTKGTKTQPVDGIKETLENISYDISNDLVAWWPFDRDSKDASGNIRHAEPKNEFSFVDGKVGKAIKLVGVAKQQSFEGGHVILPYLEELENGAFTFSLWVREDKVYFGSGHTYIFYGTICNIRHAPGPEWGGHLFDFGDDQSFQEKIVWKDWNHYSVTYDRTTKIGYLNGIEVLSEESSSPSTSHWWAKRRDKDGELIYFKPPDGLTKIGSQVKPRYKKGALGAQWFYNGSTGSTRFVGAFDDVRIYDRALSAAEIQALYKLGQ